MPAVIRIRKPAPPPPTPPPPLILPDRVPDWLLDVEHVRHLPRCRCGGFARHFQAPQGHYFLCAERCPRPGSGVYSTRDLAERAWCKLNPPDA